MSQDGADTCLEALQMADRMGLTISCDLNYRKNLWKYGRTAADVMKPLVQYSDVIFGAEPEYKEILGIAPVGFKAVNTDYRLNLEGFEEVGKQVVELVPRCRKMFLELRNSLSANHNLLAAVLYSDGSLKHTGIYDITHEVDRVGTGDAFVGGLIYGLLTYSDVKSWIVMIFMISLGISIRSLHLLPTSFISVFYTGLSLALIATGVLFIRYWWQRRHLLRS